MSVIKCHSFLKQLFETSLRAAFSDATTPEDYKYYADSTDSRSKISIYRDDVRKQTNLPAITISTGAANASIKYLGEEIVKQLYRATDETVVSDQLAYPQIARVINVKSGATTYVEDTDFSVAKSTGAFTWITTKPVSYTCTYDTTGNTGTPSGKFVQSTIEVPVKLSILTKSVNDRERITDLAILYVRSVFRPIFKPYATYIDIRVTGEHTEMLRGEAVYANEIIIPCMTHYAHVIDQTMFTTITGIVANITVQI